MRRASATVTLPGVRIADAEALWYDVTRWSSFIEGFKHVERIEGDWPGAGSRIIWQSVPDGRGRVSEHVTSYVQREGQSSDIADPRISGRQRVVFAVAQGPDDQRGTAMTLELEYELRESGPLGAVTDLLFIRRAQADALRRTLYRFARELRAEREL
jgi:Polyketide cyclase / dehydrase and lipid transport